MNNVSFSDFSYGVEIEFTGLERRESANLIAKYFGTEAKRKGGVYDKYTIQERNRTWTVMNDSSLKAYRLTDENKKVPASKTFNCELVSPILTCDSNDINIIKDLVRLLKDNKAIVNHTCSVHVHVGHATGSFDARTLRNICNIIYSKQTLLSKALKINPKRQRYCAPLPYGLMVELNSKKPKDLNQISTIWHEGPNAIYNNWHDKYHSSRYHFVNLHPILGGFQKTVEFRGFNGTLDDDYIVAYIQLSLLITAQAIRQQKTSCKERVSTNDKYALRVFLLKLGASGDEFRNLRHILLLNLKGSSSHRGSEQEPEFERQLRIWQQSPSHFEPFVSSNDNLWPE